MHKRIKALGFALSGILYCIRHEVHFRMELVAAVLVTAAGLMADLSSGEWLCIVASISAVLLAEAFNTAVEQLCNLYTAANNRQVKTIKDVAAGAVLLAACGSIVAGLIIFVPKIHALFK